MLFTILSILVPIAFAFDPNYGFEILEFNVSYEIKSDRSIHVFEDIKIKYLGQYSTGIVRVIPVHSGDRAKNVDVKLKKGNQLLNYPYSAKLMSHEHGKDLYLYVTDHVRKQNLTQTLHFSYDYIITKPHNKDAIFLNVIGFEWSANINQANVFLHLPNGYKNSNFFIGKTSIPSNDKYFYNEKESSIEATVTNLTEYNGLTFDLYFNNDILSKYVDMTPILVVIIYIIIILLLLSVKILFFKKIELSPEVNFNISKYMDPLYMKRIVNGSVNSFDTTSLVYYWASQDYITITFIEEEDYLLSKICFALPDNAPKYQKIMFDSIFQNGNEVKVSSLNNIFYNTINNVVSDVNQTYIDTLDAYSVIVSYLFIIINGIIMGMLPYYICKMNICSKLSYKKGLYILIPANFIWFYALACLNFILELPKIDKLIIILFSIMACVFYIFLISNEIMELFSKVLLSIFGQLIIYLSCEIISPTYKYIKILNLIIGFQHFINDIQKDDLTLLLKDNPQLYYYVLPYAQVLNLDDIWGKKFDSLKIDPHLRLILPKKTYFEQINDDSMNEDQYDTYDYIIRNEYIKKSRISMNQCFNSKPTPKYCKPIHNNDDSSSSSSSSYGGVGTDSYGGGDSSSSSSYGGVGTGSYGGGGCGGGGHGGGGGFGI